MGKVVKFFWLSIFVLFFSFDISFAQKAGEESIFDLVEKEVIENIEPLEIISVTKEPSLDEVVLKRDSLPTNLRNENNIIVRYSNPPSKVFLNEQFSLNLRATIATDQYDHIITTFEGGRGYTVINQDSLWLWDSSRFFVNSFIFKVSNANFKMPDIIISLVKDNEIVEEFRLDSIKIDVIKIGENLDSFSSVIAKDMKIVSHFTRQYDNNSLLTLIELEAIESNLNDFYLKDFEKQGIESTKGNFNKTTIVYYVIVPLHLDKITISYYNKATSKIETISSPIVHTKDIVSTQTDLNPHNSDMLFYKKVGFSIIVVFFIILFLFKRTKQNFAILIISMVAFSYLFFPNAKVLIPKDINIFILPTKSSSVFLKTDEPIEVEVLEQTKGYIKVLLPDEKIGWINESDIIKN
ncbi:MAG: hypothetical protein RBR07_03185 [Arcobacteraceae bacterium]|nr:hypothetical protein [Arcobacteraceae bacterium]